MKIMGERKRKTVALLLLCFYFSSIVIGLNIIDETAQQQILHVCNHDQMMAQYEPYVVPQDSPEYNHRSSKRMLAGPEPIQITLDFTALNTLSNATQKQFIIDQMTVVKTFFQHIIKVTPLATNNMFPSGQTMCFTTTVTAADQNPNGIANSDLHLYIVWENNPGASYAANAGYCILNNGPRFGQVNFNTGSSAYSSLTGSNFEFDRMLEITIHEVTHVLGFSGSAISQWFQPGTTTPYGTDQSTILLENQTVRGISTTAWLSTPNVLAVARAHYNCPSLPGMLMENQGGSGSLGSHWERSILNNEIMNAIASNTDAYFSQFSFALLLDTNWYASIDINLAEDIYNGKNKGCSWVTQTCAPDNEFCVSGVESCDFHYLAYSSCSTDSFIDQTSCYYRFPYGNAVCTDTAHMAVGLASYTKETFGVGSRCFESNLSVTGVTLSTSQRCYVATCNGSGQIVININGNSVTCTSDGQVIAAAAVGLGKGTLTCPPAAQFCFVKICPNNCSKKGVCFNGACLCSPGNLGDDCNSSCHGSCLTCTGPLKTNCSTCPTGKNRIAAPNGNGECLCNPGFYDNNGQSLCLACNPSCLTCDGGSISSCLTCPTGANRIDNSSSTQTCPCDVGFWDSGVQTCSPCHYSCATCSGSGANQCLTCKADATRVTTPVGGVCGCVDGKYDNNTLVCANCFRGCKTCNGPADNQCILCADSSFRTKNASNQCPCNDGYFDNNVAICATCDPQCFTCITNASNCNACATGAFRTTTFPACDCLEGYRSTGVKICSPCHWSCATCNGPNSNNCLSCNLAQNRETDGAGGCSCSAGFTDYGVALCSNCHYSCKVSTGCTGAADTQCNSCDTGHKRHDSGGKCVCDDGYYDIPSVSLCGTCSPSCLTCSGSSTTCLTCDANTAVTHRVNNAPTSCPCETIGYFEANVKNCSPCHQSCLQCTGGLATNCSACPTDRNPAASNTCVCKPGQFENPSNLNCDTCHYSCLTCNAASSGSCLTCPTGVNRTDNSGTASKNCPCSTGFYDDLSNTACKTCLLQCSTCTNGSGCATCNLIGTNRNNDAPNCTCQAGFYEASANVAGCVACSTQCLTCSNSATSCDSCDSSFNRVLNPTTKTCECATGFYDDGTLTCQACHSSCQTCNGTSETSCLTCVASRVQSLNNTCDCAEGFYLSSGKCLACHFSCATCINSLINGCQTCATNAFRVDNSKSNGTCPCQEGKYDAGTAICLQCDATCLTCSGTANVNCKSCNESVHFRTFVPSSNQCVCKPGFYEKTDTAICGTCDSSCITCTGGSSPNNCIDCAKGYFKKDNLCLKTCPSGFFADSKTLTCLACNTNCVECSQLSSQCTKCADSLELETSTNTCKSKVIVTTQDKEGSTVFSVECHQTCGSCYVQNSFSSCTTCPSTRELNKGVNQYTGACVCQQGYTDFGGQECQKNAREKTMKTTCTATTTTTTVLGAASMSPPLVFMQINSMQTVSYFALVNQRNTQGYDGFSQPTSQYHTTNLFSFSGSSLPSRKRQGDTAGTSSGSNTSNPVTDSSNTQRALASITQEDTSGMTTEGNEQLSLDQKYNYFVVSALSTLIIHSIAWIAVFFALRMDPEKLIPKTWRYRVKDAIYLTTPMMVLVFTSSESSLLLFYQFQNMYFDTALDAISSIIAILYSIYFFGFIGWIIFQLNKKQDSTPEQLSLFQRRFNLILSFFNDTTIAQNLIVLLILRKIIYSVIIVFLYKSAVLQISLMTITYCIFWAYIVAIRPFQTLRNNVYSFIVETEMLILHILFFLVCNSEPDSDNQVDYTYKVMIMMLVMIVSFAIIAVFQIGFFLHSLLCSKQDDSSVENVSGVYDGEKNQDLVKVFQSESSPERNRNGKDEYAIISNRSNITDVRQNNNANNTNNDQKQENQLKITQIKIQRSNFDDQFEIPKDNMSLGSRNEISESELVNNLHNLSNKPIGSNTSNLSFNVNANQQNQVIPIDDIDDGLNPKWN